MRYFLEVCEDGDRIPVGKVAGYETLEEAKNVARRKVDDALPNNTVRVLAHIATAFLAGDGSEEVRDEQ